MRQDMQLCHFSQRIGKELHIGGSTAPTSVDTRNIVNNFHCFWRNLFMAVDASGDSVFMGGNFQHPPIPCQASSWHSPPSVLWLGFPSRNDGHYRLAASFHQEA